MHTHSPNKAKKFKQTLSACQKAEGNCFLGQERSADGGVHARGTTLTSEVYCKTLKKLCRAIQKKRCGMLTYGVIHLCDNVHLYTAARTRALLEHFNWELFEHPPYSPDLDPSDYNLFTYLKNWIGSQHFNNNELIEGTKTWLSS
jgi:transposase